MIRDNPVTICHSEAVRRFLLQTGMTRERMQRAGITMERCTCGLDVCNGWLAVGAVLESSGQPR